MADELINNDGGPVSDPNVTPQTVISDCFATVDAQLAELERQHLERQNAIKADYAARVKHFTDLRDEKPKTKYLPLTDDEKGGYVNVLRQFSEMIVNSGSTKEIADTRLFRELLIRLFGTP